MHHSDTPIPGTFPAIMIVVATGGAMLSIVLGVLWGLAEVAHWMSGVI